MIKAKINETVDFYKSDRASLFWETTICRSLSALTSPYAKALDEPRLYGDILADFILARLGGNSPRSVLEIGGGEGTLMECLLPALLPERLMMVDIAPRFSALQKERLKDFPAAEFAAADVFVWLAGNAERFELVVSNENIGDFTTVVFADFASVGESLAEDGPAGEAARLVRDFGLEGPADGEFAVNLGALKLVLALAGRAGAVFLSEHSANARSAPPYDFLMPLADGRVRRIPLKDHDEYSINFDHLEKVARASGFSVERVWMPAFLGVRSDEGARFMAGAECVGTQVAEVVHEFLHHVKEYECVFLTSP